MIQGLLRALRGEAVAEPALTPPGFRGPVLPQGDEPEPAASPSLDDEVEPPLANRALVICYTDANGRGSERRIICHGVYEAEGLTYIRAHCLERQAARTFRVDRVREAYCGVTGEMLGDPGALFVPTEVRSERPLPDPDYRAAQRAVQILMTVARSDGYVHPEEERIVARFIDGALPGAMRRADRASLWDYASRLAPSFGTFLRTFDKILRYDRPILIQLFDALGPLLEADGEVGKEELRLIAVLIDRADEYGIKINIEPA